MNEVDIILELVLSSGENGMLGNIIFMFYKDEDFIYKKWLKLEAITTFICSFITHNFSESDTDSLKLSLYSNNKLVQTFFNKSRLDEANIYNFLVSLVCKKGEQE